jgi:beta-lactamase regulating signal transducer with metallopeptidase domain
MTPAVCGAVLAVVLFAVTAPRLGRRLPPALATRLLVPASLVMAACTMFVLGLLAFTWLGQLPLISSLGEWSVTRLDASDPVPESLAALSLVLLAVATVRVVLRVVRRVRSLASFYRIYRDLPSAGSVIVVDSERLDAFATPAPSGRVIVTTGLLRALNPAERRAVLAHEQSHLAHRHIYWTLAADLAAAFNPLLGPTATTVGHAVERWADEDAARTVGDRQLVARTIARAALLKHQHRDVEDALTAAATGGDVPRRVRALLDPPPRRRPLAFAVLAALLVAGTVATVAVEQSGDRLFDHAALGHLHGHLYSVTTPR